MQPFHSYHHDTEIKMLIWRFFILAWVGIYHVHGTLEPKDVEPAWLTLATGPTQQGQVHDAEMHVGNQQIEQGHHPHIPYDSDVSTTSQTERPLPIHPESTSRSIKHFKSSETRAKMRAKWTEERKRKWAEKMRAKWTEERKRKWAEKMKERIKYTPKFTRKGKFHTPETIEKIRKSRLAIPTKPSTKEKISNSLKKFQARKKEIEKEKAYFKSLHPTSSQPHGPSEEEQGSGQK